MSFSKLRFISAMGIFGTVGIFVKFIPMDAAAIAFSRGVMGAAFLALFMLLTKKKPELHAVKQNLVRLLISGAAIGLNWVLLFESYRYVSVATATVCYYVAPLMFLLASPLLGEKLTAKKLCCVGVALVGLVFVSGILNESQDTVNSLPGIFLSLGAAVLYTSVIIMNKKLTPIPAYDKTIVQLGSAATVLIPYLLITGFGATQPLTALQMALLVIVGIVHTGIAYALYFGSMGALGAQTIALFSYLDPVIAVLLSALLLKEAMSLSNIIGTILILGSALYSELPERR